TGYHTGQAFYERPSFYLTQSPWERQMQKWMLPSFAIGKLQNEFISFIGRRTTGYPAYFEMDHMTPGTWGQKDFLVALKAPLQFTRISDYPIARLQTFINYSGLGTIIGSYLETGSYDPNKRNFFKKALDWMFIPSEHHMELATIRGLQRPLDRYQEFEKRLNKILEENNVAYYDESGKAVTYREAYVRWYEAPEGSEEKKEAWKPFEKIVKIYDTRPLLVRLGHSGRDIHEDGSRNRFMELYAGFYANSWKPGYPGTVDTDPITGAKVPFPNSAAEVHRAPEGSRLSEMASYALSRYDKEHDMMRVEDQFFTSLDAYRDVYRKKDNALLHFLKLQTEVMEYSLFNSQSLWTVPAVKLAFGIGKRIFSAIDPRVTGAHLPGHHHHYSDTVYGGATIPYDEWTRQATGFGIHELAPEHKKARWLARVSYEIKESFKNNLYLAQRESILPFRARKRYLAEIEETKQLEI
ncbi:MAG: hypothetical protein N3G22_02510, partial [Candidatus Micrarchaeota archaeon]|nr:hypothetical protein [Candidatus Micrarchaeota archaeon]